MVKIDFHQQFLKFYSKRIAKNSKLVKKVDEKVKLFQQDPKNPL